MRLRLFPKTTEAWRNEKGGTDLIRITDDG